MDTLVQPCGIDFKSVTTGRSSTIRTFNSYSFDRNMMTPASAFRFTAPGVEKAERMAIRSGDLASIFAIDARGNKIPIGTGIIDETDTHGTASSIEYVLSGRDLIGQLVDNAAVDASNRILNTKDLTLVQIAYMLRQGTRLPEAIKFQGVPNAKILTQTNPGETKINTLQRYLELVNCLVWSSRDGSMVIGKANFTGTNNAGNLIASSSSPSLNNVMDFRVKRNVNQAIRRIITQLQTLGQVHAAPNTLINGDDEVLDVLAVDSRVGRSVYETFTYGEGSEAANQIQLVGNQNASPNYLGAVHSRRKVAKENVNILQVDCVVEGHFDSDGNVYDVDRIYDVRIEDEDLAIPMYCYAVTYNMTMQMGMTTNLKLCKVGNTLTADSALVAN